MAKPRPTPVTVVAILHFVFGGLGLACALISIGSVALIDPQALAQMGGPPPKGQPDPGKIQQDLMHKLEIELPIPNKTFEIGKAIFNLLFSILMIISGIGLLQLRPWGRTTSLFYAVASIVFHLAVTVYTAIFVMPVTSRLMKQMFQELQRPNMNPQEAAAMRTMTSMMDLAMWGGLFISLVVLAYPVTVLIIMNLRKTKLAFAGEPWQDERELEQGERFE